jgi:mannose-6-phosphate isomerase-like protein (cupin superfamily)
MPESQSGLVAKVRAGRPLIVEKPWGRELIFAANARFGGKILEIRGGERLSLHLHRTRHEVFYVQRGRLTLWVGDNAHQLDRLNLESGDTVDLPPGTIHRMETADDTVLVEASSPELNDIVRLEDDYGREDPATS